jgi:hypothetical protein
MVPLTAVATHPIGPVAVVAGLIARSGESDDEEAGLEDRRL